MAENLCPCGSGEPYSNCCEPFLNGMRTAPTAEAAMRARYTAYVKENVDFLRDSLTPKQRGDFSAEETRKWARESDWLGLEIVRTEGGGEKDTAGEVEFKATFTSEDLKQVHYEIARFEKENGQWLYAGDRKPEGRTVRREEPKVGRNDPCPCGSGKKFKKCCGT